MMLQKRLESRRLLKKSWLVLSNDFDDSEEFDLEEDNAKDRPSKPGHVNFDKSTIMKGH